MPTISQILQMPLGQLLTGRPPRARVAGARDYRKLIASSGLPEEVKSLVAALVRRTRLWRGEKVAVASELLSHFAEALASGETAEAAIRDFGDPVEAARLIRRGKIRGRSYLWHSFRVARNALGALVLAYVGLGIYFFAGRPSISTDYVAQLNAPLAAVPDADRAWPVYRKGWLALPAAYRDGGSSEAKLWNRVLDARADSKHFPELVERVASAQAAIAIFRDGASRTSMGFIMGRGGSADDPELFKSSSYLLPGEDPDSPQLVISVLLPHLQLLRNQARLLAADARVAAGAGDGQRAVSDLLSLIRLARQLGDPRGPLVSQLVGLGVAEIALEEFDGILVDHPAVLSDAELRNMAHALSGPKVAADLLSVESERASFRDTVQRIYTDDGEGDGRFTWKGVEQLSLIGAISSSTGRPQAVGPEVLLASGAAPLAMASRRQVVELYEALLSDMAAAWTKPAHMVDFQRQDPRIAELTTSTSMRMRYLPVSLLLPRLSRAQTTAERHIARRNALQVAAALEIHRRRAGRYPQELSALAPTLLPQVPVDPITGGPIRYRLQDGKPLIYSVGTDRDDDGGRLTLGQGGTPSPFLAADWHAAKPANGDWVLYPGYRWPEAIDEADGTPATMPSTQP